MDEVLVLSFIHVGMADIIHPYGFLQSYEVLHYH